MKGWTLSVYNHFVSPLTINASDPVAVKYTFHCKMCIHYLSFGIGFVLSPRQLDSSFCSFFSHWIRPLASSILFGENLHIFVWQLYQPNCYLVASR